MTLKLLPFHLAVGGQVLRRGPKPPTRDGRGSTFRPLHAENKSSQPAPPATLCGFTHPRRTFALFLWYKQPAQLEPAHPASACGESTRPSLTPTTHRCVWSNSTAGPPGGFLPRPRGPTKTSYHTYTTTSIPHRCSWSAVLKIFWARPTPGGIENFRCQGGTPNR